MSRQLCLISAILVGTVMGTAQEPLPKLTKLPYNHAEQTPVVDLQVGLWAQPLPMDWDGDGDLDMVAATAGVPSNGVYVYENVTGDAGVTMQDGKTVRRETGALRGSVAGGTRLLTEENPDTITIAASAAPDVVFKAGKWVATGKEDMVVSYVNGAPMVCVPGEAKVRAPGEATPFGGAVAGNTAGASVKECTGMVYPDFRKTGFENGQPIGIPSLRAYNRTRGDQWKFFDYNGDGAMDVVLGLGVWDDYGWDDAYNPAGVWTNGPLHGYVMVAVNQGTTAEPKYADWYTVEAWQSNPDKASADKWIKPEPVDVYGASSPNFADFDGDGDLDLVCGEFLDALTYFENVGTRTQPQYARGKFLARDGRAIRMDLQMLQVIALDWDEDGDTDLVVGQEDGRIALWQHTGAVEDGMPVFELPVFFKQEADHLRIGVLPTPTGADWDGDGDQDLIAGDTAGYLNFVENIGHFEGKPIWAAPVYLDAGDERVRIQAGTNGGIQGPGEAKWGYTTTTVGDWDMDGDLDIVINSIYGEILLYENVGTPKAAKLAAAQPIEVAWPGTTPKPAWFWWNPKGKQLVTQWRTSPYIGDMNGDGANDLVMLDHEGYLALFSREQKPVGLVTRAEAPDRREHVMGWVTNPGARVFLDENGDALRLNSGWAGKSGRRKFTFCDWDGDGKVDMMLDGKNVDFWKNVAEKPGEYRFKNMGPVAEDKIAGHTIAPGLVDWNKDGLPDLIAAAEDGCVYYLENPRTTKH